MKKIGIAVDDFKIDAARTALKAGGFIVPEPMKLTANTSAFIIYTTDAEFEKAVEDIAKICKTLQINFHRSN